MAGTLEPLLTEPLRHSAPASRSVGREEAVQMPGGDEVRGGDPVRAQRRVGQVRAHVRLDPGPQPDLRGKYLSRQRGPGGGDGQPGDAAGQTRRVGAPGDGRCVSGEVAQHAADDAREPVRAGQLTCGQIRGLVVGQLDGVPRPGEHQQPPRVARDPQIPGERPVGLVDREITGAQVALPAVLVQPGAAGGEQPELEEPIRVPARQHRSALRGLRDRGDLGHPQVTELHRADVPAEGVTARGVARRGRRSGPGSGRARPPGAPCLRAQGRR